MLISSLFGLFCFLLSRVSVSASADASAGVFVFATVLLADISVELALLFNVELAILSAVFVLLISSCAFSLSFKP